MVLLWAFCFPFLSRFGLFQWLAANPARKFFLPAAPAARRRKSFRRRRSIVDADPFAALAAPMELNIP